MNYDNPFDLAIEQPGFQGGNTSHSSTTTHNASSQRAPLRRPCKNLLEGRRGWTFQLRVGRDSSPARILRSMEPRRFSVAKAVSSVL